MCSPVLLVRPGCTPVNCSVCEAPATPSSGWQLCLGDAGQAVCPACARRNSPDLVALIDLAGAAERMGRIGRHTVFPPLTALLELARAAERYTASAVRPARQVA